MYAFRSHWLRRICPAQALSLALLFSSLFLLGGCSAIILSHRFDPHMGMTDAGTLPRGSADAALAKGASRSEVVARFGEPNSSYYESNQRVDVYYLDDRPRYPTEDADIGAIVMGDLYTFGLFEPILTSIALYQRIRVASGHTSDKIFLTYSADDKVESVSRGEKPQ